MKEGSVSDEGAKTRWEMEWHAKQDRYYANKMDKKRAKKLGRELVVP